VLENICNCPWDKVCNYFKEKGYSAAWSRFDTKNYYIPHTRTRGYAFAVDMKSSQVPEEWRQFVQGLSRPSSSPLEAFLLPVDDPRIHQSRQNLARESERRTGRVDWGKCESRHQRVRLEEELGFKRPFTQWKEDGSCLLPDFAWADWAQGQVDRVLDLLDISLLKSAQKGIDQAYKTYPLYFRAKSSQVLNVSQNVDRGFASLRYAICPCLTPQGLPYVSNRGGPLLGLEALSLQGLPIDELLLTRESEDNLRDLAGNAMSSTVVGACIISALVVGRKHIEPGKSDSDLKMDVEQGIHTPFNLTKMILHRI
jgi:site-specific DNA-cytosine methylase